MFSKLRPGVQMGIGATGLVVLLAIITMFLWEELGGFEHRAQRSIDENLRVTSHALEINFAINGVWQWLTDISATRGLDGLNDGFDEAEKSAQAFYKEVNTLKQYFSTTGNTKGLRTLETMGKNFAEFYQTGKSMAEAYVRGGPAEGNKNMDAFDAVAETLLKTVNPFVTEQRKLLEDGLKENLERTTQMKSTILWIAVIFIGFIAFFSAMLTRSITTYIRRPLVQVIAQLNEVSGQMTQSTDQVAAAMQTLSAGASEQAANFEETSSTMEEISSMTKSNASSGKQASELSEQAKKFAAEGSHSMQRMQEAINGIKEASDETAKIIKTIDEIAFQTNLLALNAAVEAARAGEAGRGFAVVAEEVRNLAMRSAEAAKNTNEIIEDSQKRADAGVSVALEVGGLLEQIESTVNKVSDTVEGVSQASQEQTEGVSQVTTAMSQMEQVTQSNAANAEEISASAEELNSNSRELLGVVTRLESVIGKGGKRDNSFEDITGSHGGTLKRTHPQPLHLPGGKA